MDYSKEDVVPQVGQYLEEYLSYGQRFENPPRIELALTSQTPPGQPQVGERDVAITTAYQCYNRGVTQMDVRLSEHAQEVADATLDAGHHTTRMHSYHTFLVEGTTRSSVWAERHADPYYNSEQQSQRYALATEGGYLIPSGLSDTQRQIYTESADFANRTYFDLLEPVGNEANSRIASFYPDAERLAGAQGKGGKIAQEVARYALPISQKTTMYHTLSALQLLRHFRASQFPHVTDEGRFVVASMIDQVAQVDPSILRELRVPISYPPVEISSIDEIAQQKQEFDTQLGDRRSLLVSPTEGLKEILALTVRNTLGKSPDRMTDEQALSRLFNPDENLLLADVYDVGMLDPVTKALREVSLTYITRLSHTADSQRQRHRRTPGTPPLLANTYDGTPDYQTPMLVEQNPELKDDYDQAMDQIYAHIEQALDSGIPLETALLLLPNAHSIRVVEQGDLFDWQHKWKQRLCYLAQEEIFFISVDQVEQLNEALPEVQNILLAPCGLRTQTGIRPRCPEGERWCGQPVFNWDISDYTEHKLV